MSGGGGEPFWSSSIWPIARNRKIDIYKSARSDRFQILLPEIVIFTRTEDLLSGQLTRESCESSAYMHMSAVVCVGVCVVPI